jgi:hypothetical protein
MKSVCLMLGVLCLLGAVSSAEEALTPVSKDALHFRLEVGVRPGHIITGWLDTRGDGGESFDSVVLDADGDGKVETVTTFGKVTDYRTKAEIYNPQVVVEREDAKWVLDLRYSRFQKTADGTHTYIRWSVTKGGFYAWFINGKTMFHATAEAAAKAKPLRMGPPFHFETTTSTQGTKGLVNIGLKDANGCTMRLARLDKGEVRPQVRLIQNGEQRFEEHAAYG